MRKVLSRYEALIAAKREKARMETKIRRVLVGMTRSLLMDFSNIFSGLARTPSKSTYSDRVLYTPNYCQWPSASNEATARAHHYDDPKEAFRL